MRFGQKLDSMILEFFPNLNDSLKYTFDVQEV